MSGDVAVSVKDLGKCYRLYPDSWSRIAEKLALSKRKRHEEKWALRDVTFELPRGAAMGIVGSNGAGKSTLLKILSGTTRPSTGEFRIRGTLGSLLELGAGFHPEFSGRDNLYMNAAVLGIPKADVKRRYQELAEFAELGDYLNRPVRTYSSGMAMRLGFAVAMMANPDVLILDEILAVGDQHFQKKCMDRIREIRQNGTTILFVSHSAYHVRQICDRAIWIHDGRVVMGGAPTEVTDEYVNFQYALEGGQAALAEKHSGHGALSHLPHLASISVSRAGESADCEQFRTGDEIEIRMSWRDRSKAGRFHLGFMVCRNDDVMCFGTRTKESMDAVSGERGDVVARLKLDLCAGQFYVSGFLLDDTCEQILDQRLAWKRFRVSYDGMEKGVYLARVAWRREG